MKMLSMLSLRNVRLPGAILLIWLALLGLQRLGAVPSEWSLGLGVAWAQSDDNDSDDGDDDDDDRSPASPPGGGTPSAPSDSRAPSSGAGDSRAPGPSGPSASPGGSGTASGAASPGGSSGPDGRTPTFSSNSASMPLRAEPDGFVANELLATNPSPAALRRVLALGAKVIESVEHSSLRLRTVRLSLPLGLDARTAAELASERDPGVFELHRLYRLEQGAAARPCSGVTCEAVERLGWPAPGDRCGAGQVVGMVDTEVQIDHQSLRGARMVTRRFLSPGQVPADASHGTAVAAILVGQSSGGFGGLLPQARLLAAAPFYRLPSGTTATDAAALVRSLDWLVSQGARVIGLSLSGPSSVALQTAIAQAQKRGVLLAAAAGNGGQKGEPVYPAALEGVIGVTALGKSNRVYWRANQGDHVDYALPGVDIAMPDAAGDVRQRSGTSFAVPFLVAKVSQSVAEQRLRPAQWSSGQGVPVTDLGDAGRDPVFGWGLPQVNVACR